MESFDQMCILCLVLNKNTQSVLLKDRDGIVIAEKMKYIFSDFINEELETANNICIDCLKDLNYVYNFKHKCLKNLIFLRKQKKKAKSAENKESKLKSGNSTTFIVDHNTELEEDLLECGKQEGKNIVDDVLEPNQEDKLHAMLKFENINDNFDIKSEPPFAENLESDIDIKYDPLISDSSYEEIKNEINQENVQNYSDQSIEDKDCHQFETVVIKTESGLTDFNSKRNEDILETREEQNRSNVNKARLESEEFLGYPKIQDSLLIVKETHSNNTEDLSTSSAAKQPNKKLHKCSECQKTFTQKSALKIHKRRHTGDRPYKCPSCDMAFCDNGSFKLHKMTHSGVKPFKCDKCDKAFPRFTKLRIHKLTHMEDKPFKCDLCDKAYYVKVNLLRHKIIHTGETPFKCDICARLFYSEYYLLRHKRTHNGKKPYHCDMCDKTFYDSSQAMRHAYSHTGAKLYECDVCHKLYSRQYSLTRHQLIHNNEKPYECKLCPHKCRTNYHLKLHVQKIHQNNKD